MDMRVWIGCLACYNAGRLVGKWYNATDAAEITTEQLHRNAGEFGAGVESPDAARWTPPGTTRPVVFADGPHEELWCMDTDGFGGLIEGECSPMEATRVAELVASVSTDEIEALGHFRANYGGELTEETVDDFRESYQGLHDSENDFAYQLADDMGFTTDGLSWPANYIDWDAATRDLFMDGYWSADGHGGVHVFRDI